MFLSCKSLLLKRIFSFLCIITLLSISLVFNVYSEDPVPGVNKLYVTAIKIASQSEKSISGTITIKNDSIYYFPELMIATELYLDGKPNSSFINSTLQKFDMEKTASMTLNFVHNIPISLPKGNYSILARIYSRSGMPLVFKEIKLKPVTTDSPFISFNYDSSHLLKDSQRLSLNEGPNYKAGQSPTLVATYKNLSSLKFSAKPHIEVFERNVTFSSTPVTVVDGQSVMFNSKEEKTWHIAIPALSKPESYVASISLLDVNSKKISDTVEVRFVIEGASSKTLNTVAYLDETGNIKLQSSFAGPADGSELKDVTLKTTVFPGDANNAPITKEEKFTAGSMPQNTISSIPANENMKDFSMLTEVIYNGKVLDSYKTTYNAKKILANKTITKISPNPDQTQNSNNSTSISPAPTSATSTSSGKTRNYLLLLLLLIVLILIAVAIYLKFAKKKY